MSLRSVVLVLFIFSFGCATKKEVPPPPQAQTNALGIVKTQPGSYAKLSPTSINVHTDELGAADDYSGNKTTLLWGLVTVADY